MSVKSLPCQPKPRSLKKEAAEATVRFSIACASRAFNLYRKENDINIKSWKEVNMNHFWKWIEATPSISESTKESYSRSVCRELKIPVVKFKKPISKRKEPTVDLFEEILGNEFNTSIKFESKESVYSKYVFILMSITGLDIRSILDSKILSDHHEINGYSIYYYLVIQTNKFFKKTSELTISKLQVEYYINVDIAFSYINKIYDKSDIEKNKIAARIRYFIHKILSKYGHTTKSARKSFSKILGYVENTK